MPSNFSIAIAILTHLRRFSMRVFSAFLKQAGVLNQGILKGGSITLLLTSCLTGLKAGVCIEI